MPLQATSGAASYDAFGGGVVAEPNYIESCFSTWLYTGNGATQTINNGIDLAGKGGLVWLKGRSATSNHSLYDTARGINRRLRSNDTSAENTSTQQLTSFNSNGFDLGVNEFNNSSGLTAASWTFREQPKFFDVVTYTGTGSARTIAHNLGSVPGMMIVKCLNDASSWTVYHRSLGATQRMFLEGTGAAIDGSSSWNSTEPSASNFSLGTSSSVNGNGLTFVAYLFAHNAGGFGLSGNENVISCGSYTGNGSSDGPTVTLGYEPQWLMVKCSSDPYSWIIVDNMRGMDQTGSPRLFPNTSDAESAMSPGVVPTATGFKINTTNATVNDGAGVTYIYIAIRRGPMRTPTTGTSVFNGVSRTGTDANATISSIGFPPDTLIVKNRSGTASPIGAGWLDRLRGLNNFLTPSASSAEDTAQTDILRSWNMNGATLGPDANTSRFNWSGNTYMNWFFARAPGFMDVVCYTGTGVARTVTHNLGVAPELIIFKARSLSGEHWGVWVPAFGFSSGILRLSTNDAVLALSGRITGTSATTVTVGTNGEINNSGSTYVAYLFASCPGVSKVFSYTGNGSSQTINCGFTGGARFVMIKRTDSTGDWYVWDTARGIVANNDPHLSLNSTAAEVTTNDTIDTNSTGFVVNQVSATNVNVSSATYIGLAIA